MSARDDTPAPARCRVGESRRGLWTLFRRAFYRIAFDTWEALLRYHLRETTPGP